MSSKKENNIMLILIQIALILAFGIVCGKTITYVLASDSGFIVTVFATAILFPVIYIASVIHIIIHEAGHLIFGRLSGYRFLSFRIGKCVLKKTPSGGVKLKKLHLAGTGGQCLMSPPDLCDGKTPYTLYLLGGVLANIIVSLLFGVAAVFLYDKPLVFMCLLLGGIMGIYLALVNGLPMRVGQIYNDGYCIWSMKKDASVIPYFWIQMKAVELQSLNDKRLKDMPGEWFEMPDDERMKNYMASIVGVLSLQRLMDEHRFDEAEKAIEKILAPDCGIVGLYRQLLTCDLIYCRLLKADVDKAKELYENKELIGFMRSMKEYPMVLRTKYTYALIAKKDADESSKIKKTFNRISSAYPYPCEIAGENELIEIADKFAANPDEQIT